MPDRVPGERLAGGNVGGAYCRGDVVVRPGGAWTSTIQRLLAHLRAKDLDWVPEPRGIDAGGNDLTSYVDGVVPSYPMPEWVWDERNLVQAAQLLRRLHDVSGGFDVEGATWRMPAHEPVEVICHNDFAPYNFVYLSGVMTGVIDWDLASPGPRVWDLAYLAYRLVPLTAPDNPDVLVTGVAERRERLATLCESYGDLTPVQVLDAVPQRLDELAAVTEAMARDGNAAVAGHASIYRADADWARRNRADLV